MLPQAGSAIAWSWTQLHKTPCIIRIKFRALCLCHVNTHTDICRIINLLIFTHFIKAMHLLVSQNLWHSVVRKKIIQVFFIAFDIWKILQWTSYWHSRSWICSSLSSPMCRSCRGWCWPWGIPLSLNVHVWERHLMDDFTTKLPVPSMSDQTTNYHICCCRLKDRVSMHLLLLWRVLNTVKNSGKASYSRSGIRSVSSPVYFFHMTTK